MARINKKEFIDENSKISSLQIEQCNDVKTLVEWKMTIDSNIATTQITIDKAKANVYKNGEYSDGDWWARVNGYKRMLGFLSQKIQYRLRELRDARKTPRISLDTIFVDLAKEMLEPDVFQKILGKAQQVRATRENEQKYSDQ